jgi:RHS repeat-associated protein
MSAPRSGRPPRWRAVALAALVAATTFIVDAAPVSLPAPLDEALGPTAVQAGFCASNASFSGRLTASSSSTTAVSRVTSPTVYGYISNVTEAWSCTLYYRYSGLTWNTSASAGTFRWGNLINSQSVACNFVVGSTDYLKGNSTSDCPDTDAEYALSASLNPQGVYHADYTHNGTGDFSFVHTDCGTYYGGALSPLTGQSFSTGSTGNRPGANCDPIDLDSTNTSQTVTYDSTAPVRAFTTPSAAAYPNTTATYNVVHTVTETVAGFGGSNVWKLQRQKATLTAPNTCGTYANDPAAGNLTTGTTTGSITTPQTLVAATCYRWLANATDLNGNVATQVLSATMLIDTVAPTTTFTAPVTNTTTVLNATSTSVEWSETDAHSGVLTRSLQRRVATYSGGACGSYANDGSALTTASPVAVGSLVDGKCYQWIQTLTDRAGNSTQTTSGTIRIDVGSPSTDFTTPDEGSTTITTATSYDVAWTETAGSGTITSRSLQRQRVAVATPSVCPATGWIDDGSPYTGTSPRTDNPPLVSGYCYRWLQTLTNSLPKTSVGTSGAVLVDTSVPTGTIDAPAANAPLSGPVTISGTAADPESFKEYELEVGAGTSPSSWTSLGIFSTPIPTSGTLHTWSPGGLSGVYTIRLTVRQDASAATQVVSRTVVLENAGRGEESFLTRVPFDLGGGWSLDVGVHNGEARLSRGLFSIPSYGPAQALDLSYSSAETGTAGRFGTGWSSNLTQYLSFDATDIVTWHRADGGRVPFGKVAGVWTAPAGHHETLSLSGGEYTITATDQTKVVFESTGAGRLKRLENRFAKALTLVWNTSSATATDASGRVTNLVIDSANDRITSATDSAGRSWSFGYTGGDLTSVTDPASKVTTLGYTGGLLTSVTRSRSRVSGAPETVTWTVGYTSGKATAVTDPVAATTASTFTYNPSSTDVGLLRQTTPSVVRDTWTHAFDSLGRVTSTTDPLGFVTTRAYDSSSNVVTLVEPIGTAAQPDTSTTTSTYDGKGNPLTEVVPIDGSTSVTTVYTYNATNDLLTRTDTDEDATVRMVTKHTYDGSGHLTSTNVNCTTSGTTPPGQGQGGTCTGGGTQDAATNLITNYAYTANDQLAFEQDPLGRVTKYGYDPYGDQTSVTRNCTSSGTTPPSPFSSCTGAGTADAQTNVVQTSTFDQATTAGKAGLPTRTTDALGRHIDLTYDALGRQLTEALPGDASIPALTRTTTYDELGNVLTDVESWTGVTRTTSHVYDLANRESSVTDPSGVVTTTTYDLAGNATGSTAGGVTTSSTFDGLGRVGSETNPDGTTDHTYDAQGNEISTDSGDGDTTERTFTRTGWLTQELSDPLGLALKTDHAYDRLGRELTVTDPYTGSTPGTTTTMTYDRAGRQLTSQVTGGPLVTTTYDRMGNAVAVLDADGRMSASLVDPLDRVTTSIANCTNSGTTVPAAGSTCAGTGTADAVTNLTTRTYYDETGATVAAKDPKGITVRTILNVRGLPAETIANCTDSGTTPTTNPPACVGAGTANDTTNVRSTTTYDGSGAALTTITAVGTGEQATTYTAYDGAGRALGTKDPLNTVSTTQYDAEGRVASTIVNCTEDTSSPQPPTGSWWTCDGSTLNDGTWNVKTTYAYDAAGNQTSVIAPNGRETRTAYDADGRVTQRIDNYVDGVAGTTDDLPSDYFYDDAGRQTGILAPTASGTTRTATRFTYNADGTLASEIRDCTSTGTTVPSNAGECTGLGAANAETNVTTSYQYDSRGNRIRLTAPDPAATSGTSTATVTAQYAFDAADRLCRVVENATGSTNLQALADPCSTTTQTAGTTTTNVSTRYTYDPAGNLASMIDARGNTTTYGYDANGRMTTLTDASGETLVWVYDALGNRIRQENRADPIGTNSVQWTYDGAGRMVSRIADAGAGPADTTAPSVPTTLDATAVGSSRVDLSWTGSTDAVGVTRYTIKRDGVTIADVSALATSFSDRSVAPSTTYSYTVSASDAAGNTSAASTADGATTGAGATIYASDDFTRTTSGWGTAPTGGTWTNQNTTDITTTGSTGRHSVPSETTRWTRLGSVSAADQEGLLKIKVSSLTGSGTVAYARIETRADSTYANYYRYQVQFGSSGAIAVVIRKLVAGSVSTLRSDSNVVTGLSASDWLWLRWKITNSGSDVALTYKAWKDGTSEPGSFATTYTDVAPGATFTGAGRLMVTSQALSGYTGSFPYLIDYDDLSIATPGTTADTTAPTVPTDLAASPAGSKQIDLAWTASTDAVGVHAYKVYRGGTYLATTGSTSWSDTGLSSSTNYSYTVSAIDGAANESAQTDAESLTTTPDGATTYTYDATGNLLTAGSGAATITMTYDRLGRVLAVDDDDLGTTADTAYTYSLTSPSWTDPSGAYAATLDKFDRPTAVNDPVNATDFTWAYRADGQPSSMAQPNGNTTAFAYDALGRLTSKDTTAAGPVNRALYDWTYNRAGQILTELETITGGASNGTVTYGYDPLARLATSALSGTTTTYGWDAGPNRTSVQVGAGSTATTTFDVANRPTSGTNPTASYTNDDDGRLTARPNQTLEWDHLGRLTAVKDAAGTTTLARYTYDPLDRLKVVEHPGVDRIRFRYVGATTSVVQWLDDIAGSVTRSVANGWTGERLADWTGSGSDLRIYGSNAHHDTTWLASDTGTVSQSLRYDPWGTPRSTVPTGYSPFRFQGSWHDATTDLAWIVTRWYAPAQGRFVSEDTLLGEPTDPPSRHLYAYGQGEPIGRWDPDGRFWYKLRDGDTLRRLAARFLGDPDRSTRIANANPGGRITPVHINRAWVPRAGQCLWIPSFKNLAHQCGRRGDAKYGPWLYGLYLKSEDLIFRAMHRNRVDGAGGIGLFTGGGGLDGIGDAALLARWAWKVRDGGDWDYKVQLRRLNGGKGFWHPVPQDPAPERLFYDVWANIHYGYVGRAHRIPRNVLVWGARDFGGGFDAGDEISVRLGMDLWEQRSKWLTLAQLRQAVRNAIPRWRRATDFHVIPPLTGKASR